MESAPNQQQRPYRVCEACGSLTPREAPRCAVCGEPSIQALQEEQERASERRFAQVIFGRKTTGTWALIAANVVVFVAMSVAAGSMDDSSSGYMVALVNFGAKLNALIDRGEYWRLVTPIFIHIGLFHLGVNMYSLYILGPTVERLYGTARFLVLYLLTGVAGVVGSYYTIGGASVPSAGASGALFGLIGVLLVFGFRYRNELPGVFRKAFSPMQLLPILALNLWITFAIPAIDKGAHLGGLAAGMILAGIVPYTGASVRAERVAWRIAAAICIAAILGSFGAAYLAPKRTAADINDLMASARSNDGDGAPASGFVVSTGLIDPYNETSGELADAVNALVAAADGTPPAADAATRARAAAAIARRAKGVDARSRELFERRGALLERAADMLSTGGAPPTRSEVRQLAEEARSLDADWNRWLESEGPKYNLETKPTK